MNISIEILIFWAAILMLASVFSSKVSDRFAVPALLLFLIIGIVAGSEGLGGIYFDNYQIAKSIGVVALIFIIFLGGIDTSWKTVRPLMLPAITLSTLGVLITAVIVGLFSTWILKFSPLEGLLLGAIVSSTDAAAVFTILRSRRISFKGHLKPLLELESGSNDPMAVFLTVTLLSMLSGNGTTALDMVFSLILNIAIGALIGYLMSKICVAAINSIKLEYEGLYPVLTISLVLLTYAVTSLLQGNGFLAVYLLGLFMSKSQFSYKRALIRFHEGIAWLMQITMFLTLGLLVFPSKIIPVFGQGLLIAAILLFIARPISIFLCLIPSKFKFQEKLMISWVGLRGAVPIILATFPLLAGVKESSMIFHIVFFVVCSSVLLQGTSIPFVSKLLKLQAPLNMKKRFPIEFEESEGIDASLTDIIVPYDSASVGKTISELKVPAKALIVLISRAEKFIVPSGATMIEGGDVLLVLGKETDIKTLQTALARLNDLPS